MRVSLPAPRGTRIRATLGQYRDMINVNFSGGVGIWNMSGGRRGGTQDGGSMSARETLCNRRSPANLHSRQRCDKATTAAQGLALLLGSPEFQRR